jgi:hypothetical protein
VQIAMDRDMNELVQVTSNSPHQNVTSLNCSSLGPPKKYLRAKARAQVEPIETRWNNHESLLSLDLRKHVFLGGEPEQTQNNCKTSLGKETTTGGKHASLTSEQLTGAESSQVSLSLLFNAVYQHSVENYHPNRKHFDYFEKNPKSTR